MASPAERKGRILVVDDHIEMARVMADQLGDAGYTVEIAAGGKQALAAARARPPDVVVTDLRMEGVDGFDVLEGIAALDGAIPVLIMTAFGAIDSAIDAIRRGAYHYLTKPFRLDEVLLYVERALADRRLRDEHRALRRLAGERTGLATMIGRGARMNALCDLIERVAQAQAPVLIRGESGTGKELVARALHFGGPRRERPFVAVNCTALPESLLESELFGHTRGAFTGATSGRRGLFSEADGGTLFLDEIGDMAPALQAKLLRAIEEGEVRAVGADGTRTVDVRVIAASHQDLEARIKQGEFRADLYYRLNVVPVVVPPLRERREDIPQLCDHFLARARERNPAALVRRLSPEALSVLARSPWPGNVRELENVLERLVIVVGHEVVSVDDLAMHAPTLVEDATPLDRAKADLLTLRQLERDYIAWVIERCDGNKTRAAEILAIDVSTIHRRERGLQ
ncbi:MAG: sigma-54-dependent Fis family transcriptional regulator [Deltaproteobacteria bacterium]|nr:sigma-54-dependent Fis family transcriptional regulator [Deltaproteobacteria bacterium]